MKGIILHTVIKLTMLKKILKKRVYIISQSFIQHIQPYFYTQLLI